VSLPGSEEPNNCAPEAVRTANLTEEDESHTIKDQKTRTSPDHRTGECIPPPIPVRGQPKPRLDRKRRWPGTTGTITKSDPSSLDLNMPRSTSSESPQDTHLSERIPNASSYDTRQAKSLPCGEPVTGKTVQHVLMSPRAEGVSLLMTARKDSPGSLQCPSLAEALLSRFPRQGPSEATTNYISASVQDNRTVTLHHRRHGVELHMTSLSTDSRYPFGVSRHGSLTCRIRSVLSNSALRAPRWPNQP
jgi:hypothetical protein